MKFSLKTPHTAGIATRGEGLSGRLRRAPPARWYQAQSLLFAGAPSGGQRY
jgi:hypothetical protein